MNTDDKKNLSLILGALLIAVSPHAFRLPLWIVIWCLGLWGYVYWATQNNRQRPGRTLRLFLTIGAAIAGLATFGYSFRLDTGVALLALMLGIKPLEIHSHRDRMVTLFLINFLIITNLFYSNALVMTLYMFGSVFITTAVLIHINHSQGALLTKLRLSGVIMVQALPLMIILFFLFPRIPGSLFGITKQSVGTTGFSDTLSPGSISRLVRSSEIAFRVEFNNNIPNPDHLYWRGIVFKNFDGETWSQGFKLFSRPVELPGENSVEYTITLEPHGKKWLFALDLPITSPSGTRMLDDLTLMSFRDVKERMRYTVKSRTIYNTGDFKPWELKTLKLPAGVNPKAFALARKWADASGTPDRIVKTALEFFAKNNFAYSLNPPQLDSNPVDDFLFRTRKGYCEHYASAFAFLMRAANIPARIVGGYLGGELNPYGDYMIVRQSDAHAWVEVWLPARGWVRIDPTSAVAPERVEQGMAAALPPEELETMFSIFNVGPLKTYWKKAVFGWDVANKYWNQWVLGYSYLRQKTLLSKIGIHIGSWKGPLKALLLAAALISVLVFLLYLGMFKSVFEKKDAVLRAYAEFCTKLARAGIARKPAQGPVDYARKAGYIRRDLKEKIHKITELYVFLRYARGGDQNERAIKDLKALVKKFDPNRP